MFTFTRQLSDDPSGARDEKPKLFSSLTLSWLSNSSRSNTGIDSPAPEEDKKDPRSWIKGLRICTWILSFIFSINVILTITGTILAYHTNNASRISYAPIYSGSCSLTKRWTTGMHLVINFLSTIMLGASNYCMQCLASPSRGQVDAAHSNKTWLRIGAPDIWGLLWGRRAGQEGRRWMLGWVLLGTSLPIHLIYNSAMFYSLGPTEYTVIAAQEPTGDSPLTTNTSTPFEACFEDVMSMDKSTFNTLITRPDLTYLPPTKCMDMFAQEYVSGQSMLILITGTPMPTTEPLSFMGRGNSRFGDDWGWMCPGPRPSCSRDEALNNVGQNGQWTVQPLRWSYPMLRFTVQLPTRVFNGSGHIYVSAGSEDDTGDVRTLNAFLGGYPSIPELQGELDDDANWEDKSFPLGVNITGQEHLCGDRSLQQSEPMREDRRVEIDHCLAVPAEERCQLYYSLPICLIVLACNLIKLVCTVLSVRDRREDVFLTIGDAIASFLSRPDPNTEGCCLLSKPLIDEGAQGWHEAGVCLEPDDRRKLALPLPKPKRWFQAVEKGRWILTIALFICLLIPASSLLHLGIQNQARSTSSSIWSNGLGEINASNLLSGMPVPNGEAGVFAMVLLANIPQLLVSVAYFLLNAVLTCMLGAVEYTTYSLKRRPLRVSWPNGEQRSTYYLSLPYRYSLFLLALSAVWHWLVSQSLFFAQIVPVGLAGEETKGRLRVVTTCGYSPVAIIFAIVVGMALLIGSMLLGLRRLKGGLPIAGQCSAAISAACHVHSHSEGEARGHALKPVMWGEVGEYEPSDGLEFRNRLGEGGFLHCSFTSGEVDEPRTGRLYI